MRSNADQALSVPSAGVSEVAAAAPAVSVVMPAYNAAGYVAEAVESILAQTYRDFELIAIDDGSTDRTREVLDRYARADGRVRVIRRPDNGGIVAALNDGLAAARGALIARMDADDVALPERLERQVRWMDEHPEQVAVGTWAELVDPYGVAQSVVNRPGEPAEVETALLAGDGWAVIHPTVVMRADAVRTLGGYREAYRHAEDLDLFLRLSERGGVGNVPQVLLRYRQHLKSVNRTQHELQHALVERTVGEARARRGMPPLPPGTHRFTPPKPAAEQVKEWAWVAIKRRQRRAARRHALTLLRLQPTSAAAWMTLYCALRGR